MHSSETRRLAHICALEQVVLGPGVQGGGGVTEQGCRVGACLHSCSDCVPLLCLCRHPLLLLPPLLLLLLSQLQFCLCCILSRTPPLNVQASPAV
jgi:hypothetical protein